METKNKNDVNATESVGLTETQNKSSLMTTQINLSEEGAEKMIKEVMNTAGLQDAMAISQILRDYSKLAKAGREDGYEIKNNMKQMKTETQENLRALFSINDLKDMIKAIQKTEKYDGELKIPHYRTKRFCFERIGIKGELSEGLIMLDRHQLWEDIQ